MNKYLLPFMVATTLSCSAPKHQEKNNQETSKENTIFLRNQDYDNVIMQQTKDTLIFLITKKDGTKEIKKVKVEHDFPREEGSENLIEPLE